MENCEGPYRACYLEAIIVGVLSIGGAVLGCLIIIWIIDKIIPVYELDKISEKNAFTEIVSHILTIALFLIFLNFSFTYIAIPARNIIFTWIANM